MDARQAGYARQALDARLQHLNRSEQYTPPARGWVRAIREALGMSRAELGARMGIKPASVSDLETSEADRRIKLATLARAADAMDCDLVYALIPRTALKETVERAARAKITPHLVAVTRTMELEDQAASPGQEIVAEEIQKVIDAGQVWS
jgi:predicted DNA-binding mobile mystery protein A